MELEQRAREAASDNVDNSLGAAERELLRHVAENSSKVCDVT